MKKKKSISQEEQSLFRSAVSDAKPLESQNRVHHNIIRTQKKVIRNHVEDDVEEIYRISDFIDPSDYCTSNQQLSFKTAGVQNRQFQKLKQGQIMVEECLDLHGLTIDQARKDVDLFIADCKKQQIRCIIIVHGKGGRGKPPMLKTMTNHWLKQINDIIAFTSAQPSDGGTGAVYALLRK